MPSAIMSGVPASSQSTPARSAISAVATASSIVTMSNEICTIGSIGQNSATELNEKFNPRIRRTGDRGKALPDVGEGLGDSSGVLAQRAIPFRFQRKDVECFVQRAFF